MERKRVLVVGGSGYLGQHLLAALAAGGEVDVAFTHHRDTPPQPLLHALPGLRAFRVDLRSGDGLRAVSESFGQVPALRFPFQVVMLLLVRMCVATSLSLQHGKCNMFLLRESNRFLSYENPCKCLMKLCRF